MVKKKIFLVFLLLFVSSVMAAPVTDLNITLTNAPAIQGKSLSFQLDWNGTPNPNTIYWQFDTDGNVIDKNSVVSVTRINTVSPFFVSGGAWYNNGTTMGSSGVQTANTAASIPSGATDLNSIADFNAQFTMDWNGTNVTSRLWVMADANTNASIANGLALTLLDSGDTLEFLERKGGVTTTFYNPVGQSGDTPQVYRITRVDGNTTLFRGGVILFSTMDYDVNVGTVAVGYHEGAAAAAGTTITNFDANYQVNTFQNILRPTTQTHTFNTSGSKTIYATAQNIDGNTPTSITINVVSDLNAPTIFLSDFNVVGGLSVSPTDFNGNYAIGCIDDFSTNVDVNIINNDTNILAETITNGDATFALNQAVFTGQNTVRYNCRDAAGNVSTTVLTPVVFTGTFFWVYAQNGNKLLNGSEYTLADVNSMWAYTADINIDMYTNNITQLYFAGDENDSIRFVTTYQQGTSTGQTLHEFDVIVMDENSVGMCFSPFQSFREQRIVSSSRRPVIIQSATTDCYIAMARVDYTYADSFKLSIYTIPLAYNLYTFDLEARTRTLLSLIDGTIALEHNLDLLILNAQPEIEVNISTDQLIVARQCQVTPDCNVLLINYTSPQDNDSVTIQVLNGSTILMTTTDTSNPEDVNISWNFTSADVNADFLTLRAIVTRSNGSVETIDKLFTLNGIQGFLDPALAIMLAFGFFYFIFTLVASRFGLGWVGIIGVIGSLSILSTAPGVQLILLAEAIFITIGAVLFFTWKNETAKVI